MVKIKAGFDVHGVIDKDPNFFAYLSYLLRMEGHEIHIITGRELCDELLDKLNTFNVGYTQIFSITSYHKEIGTPITYKDGDPSQPIIESSIWNRTKADYAKSSGLHFHIDDSSIYEKFFRPINTQYFLYTPELRELLFQIVGWSENFNKQLHKIQNLHVAEGAVNL